MGNTVDGQLTIFDLYVGKKRPCDYRFKRYIGQTVAVHTWHDGMRKVWIGTVKRIEPYYTIVNIGGEEIVGTPTNTSEVHA